MSHRTRQRRPTIGVLAGWQFAWTATPLSYLDPIFHGIRLAAQDVGCNVLLGCGMGLWTDQGDSLRPAWPISTTTSDFVPIGPWNTCGLVAINPLHSPERSRYVQGLRAAGHPLIFIASGEDGPTIVADNRSGALEAMQHLIDHGHRRIAFVAGSPEDMEGDSGERLRAYQDAVKMHGLPSDPRLVAWGRHRYDGGYVAIREMLASGVAFTAVLASNDESAMGAMQALREVGRRIPQDVAVIGFDDRPECAVQEPPLSSVRIPLRNMGYRAVESLFRYVAGRAETIESSRVATRLVARQSCGCDQNAPRVGAPRLVQPQGGWPDRENGDERLIRAMAGPVLAVAQGLRSTQVVSLCRCLADAFYASIERGDPSEFRGTLQEVLHQVAVSGDDVHVWQVALSNLEHALDGLPASTRSLAGELLDEARVSISARLQHQLRRHLVDHRWTLNRLGTLTARLLATLDETEVYRVLAQYLPEMGIHAAWIGLLSSEDDDPVAWTTLRDITSPEMGRTPQVLRFRSREFPPEGLLPADQPFSLALFPLTGPRGQLGYVIFDAAHLDLGGAITQQLATALNSAQLYREATEGRRLAEEASELKSRFLSTVSHELRTPLNLVVGLSGLLLKESQESDPPLPEQYRRDIVHIHASAQHLGGLIGDVLDLASSSAGQLRLANEYVDLSEALRLVAETGEQLAHAKGLGWHAALPESGPWVRGDRTRLRQIVLNLINNAVKFTAQGEVRLDVESGAGSVTVAVHDTGLGIPQEEQSLIFDEFHRSERSMAHGYGGLGLGLAICRQLVKMHGGTIGVRSSGEDGAGSTFYFTLPTVQLPGQVQCPAVKPLTAQSVAVLTNHVGGGQQLREHLAERGLEVQIVLAEETPDWLSQLAISPPGAVVVDVGAAPHQGWGALKAIKSHPRTQHLPVLFCSLSPDGGSVLELDYLSKPIEMADLTRALDQHALSPDASRDVKAILVVDDDLDTLEMHARIVQAHSPSHRVVTARNGLEALDVLRREQIDLVLLDLIMPEVDGFGVLEAMREQEAMRDIPVIVLTGQVLTEEDMARLDQGVAMVLSKGVFSLEETLAHVDATLERSRTLGGDTQRLVRQAMAYIHTHYSEPISRADLAGHVALSEDYLTLCFRKELGVTPIAYLNRYRVNQARQLLTDSSKSITEIALEVGFSDSGYFSRIFRREVGMSPDAYRRA